MTAMLVGATTILRAPEERDDPVLAALRNDVEIQHLLLGRARPNSTARVREWVGRLGSDPESVLFVIARPEDQAAVGFLQITHIDTINGVGRLGIAVRRDSARRGHGRAAIELVCPYLHEVFGLRKLVLDVRADNTAAVSLYRSLAFREVGVWRDHHRVGDRYFDVMSMERFITE